MRQGASELTNNGIALIGASLSTSFTCDPQNLFNIYAYSIQISWNSGTTLTGTFHLEASDDPSNQNTGAPNSPAPTNWTLITGSTQDIVGTPGNITYDVTQCGYRWTRIVYTATIGDASIISAFINVKGS